MAKHQKPKKVGAGRNGDRPNGKAWGKHSGTNGHHETGRTKPSGHSVGGHSVRKIRTTEHDAVTSSAVLRATMTVRGITQAGEDKINASRNAQHRRTIRQGRSNVKSTTKFSK